MAESGNGTSTFRQFVRLHYLCVNVTCSSLTSTTAPSGTPTAVILPHPRAILRHSHYSTTLTLFCHTHSRYSATTTAVILPHPHYLAAPTSVAEGAILVGPGVLSDSQNGAHLWHIDTVGVSVFAVCICCCTRLDSTGYLCLVRAECRITTDSTRSTFTRRYAVTTGVRASVHRAYSFG